MGAAFSYNPFTNTLDKPDADSVSGSVTLLLDSGISLTGTIFNFLVLVVLLTTLFREEDI